MPEVDQITRPNDQSEQSRPDKIQQRKSPVDRTPELPTDRHETPSIAPITAKRLDAAATADQRSSSLRRQRVRWMMFALLPFALIAGAYWYVTGGQVMSTTPAANSFGLCRVLQSDAYASGFE
jgi:membrane fusion protein (multidrug efflux system)